jgi:hypothetical protein
MGRIIFITVNTITIYTGALFHVIQAKLSEIATSPPTTSSSLSTRK